MKPILGERVLYVGDPVALVAAETREIADEAIELIEVEYEVLPAVTSGIEAIKDGAPQLYPGMFKNNIVTPGYPPFQKDGPFWHLVKGDPEKGFEECAYIAEDTVEFSKMAAPASPEPPGAIVRWEGGSYGNKQSQVQIVSSAAVLSMKTGRPVKFYQTKAEQMCCFETRLGSQVHAKIGMDKDGVVKAVKAEWTADTGCLSNATQGQIGAGIGEAQLVMCKCPNWDLDTNLVVTNMPCWAPSARRKARRCRCALSGSRRLRRCFPLLRPGHPLRPRRPYRAAQGIR